MISPDTVNIENVTEYTKLFDLLDITDFSQSATFENSKKFEILAERLYQDKNPNWEKAWKIRDIFYGAACHYGIV
jgi:hypothetical protein